MTVRLGKPRKDSIPVHTTDRAGFAAATETLDAGARRWLKTLGFSGAPDTHALQPAADGGIAAVWAGVRSATDPWAVALLPKVLPVGNYHLGDAGLALDDGAAAMS